MFVVTVIPLKRATTVTNLTYYSKHECPVGSLLTIPIRSKLVPGIVTHCTSAHNAKTSVRSADFSLRKLPPQTEPRAHVPKSITATAEALQAIYPTTIGSILYALIPTDIKAGYCIYPTQTATVADHSDTTGYIIQAPIADRYTMYQSHVRSCFAQGGSVVFVAPSSIAAANAYQKLQTGITDRTICLTPAMNKRSRIAAYNKALSCTQPILLITTPAYAYIERADTTSMIVEQIGQTNYTDQTRPYLDHRLVLQTLARLTNRTLVVGDTIVRTEDEWLRRNDTWQSFDETPKRMQFPAKIRVLTHTHDPTSKEPFPLFIDETVNRLTNALQARGNVFLYAARRGLAPLIVCFDCGEVVRCPLTGNPYSLLRTVKNGTEQRWFVDSASGKRVRATDTCTKCGSWRLRERGIGIQQIHDACSEYFPHTPLIYFDSLTASTPKKALDLQTKMAAAEGTIFLGTAIAIPYLPPSVAVSCITSYEAASSIPSWRADEILFRLLTELRERSQHEVIVQTRHEPNQIVDYASQGAVEKFYTEEIALRESLKYPPFYTLILLSWRGTLEQVQAQEEALNQQLQEFSPLFYSNPLSHRTQTLRFALLRIPADQWPHPDIIRVLKNLPLGVKIQINPDRIV